MNLPPLLSFVRFVLNSIRICLSICTFTLPDAGEKMLRSD